VAAAEPYLALRLRRLVAGVATESAERRARAATEAAEAIAAHPDPLVRDAYEREVALRCRLSEARVHELVEARRRVYSRLRRREPEEAPALERPALPVAEREAIRAALLVPERVVGRISPALLTAPLARRALDVLCAADTFADALGTTDEEVAGLLAELATETVEPDETAFAVLARAAVRRRLLDLAVEAKESAVAFQRMAVGRSVLASLHDGGEEAVEAAVAWLDAEAVEPHEAAAAG